MGTDNNSCKQADIHYENVYIDTYKAKMTTRPKIDSNIPHMFYI